MPARPALLFVLAAGLVGGCGEEEVPPVAGSCTGDPAEVVAALSTAPEQVTLPDGARISACVKNARSGAELQNVGVTFSSAAEDLEARAIDGDAASAVQLGYLVGAASRGAKTTGGVAAELVHRLERSAGFDGTAEVDAALERGVAAGERLG